MVKKAAGAVKKRFSAQGRAAAAQKKGAKIALKTKMHTQKTSNIAAKAKLKQAKAAHKAAKGPSKIGAIAKKVIGAGPKKPSAPASTAPASGGLADRIKKNVPKAKTKMKVVPGKGIVSAEYDPEIK